jgi:hypothetical protein
LVGTKTYPGTPSSAATSSASEQRKSDQGSERPGGGGADGAEKGAEVRERAASQLLEHVDVGVIWKVADIYGGERGGGDGRGELAAGEDMRREREVGEGDERGREAVLLDETPRELSQRDEVAGAGGGQQHDVRPLGVCCGARAGATVGVRLHRSIARCNNGAVRVTRTYARASYTEI